MKVWIFSAALAFASAGHAFSVKVETSSAQSVQLSIDALGVVASDLDAQVRTRLEGSIETIAVSEGDPVTQGQLIARLADDDRALDLARAEQEFTRLKAEATRGETLFEQQLITTSALEALRSAAKSAESALASARQAVAWREVTAPFDGVVTEIHVEVGEVVGRQSAVARMINPSQVEVQLEVPQNEIAQIQNGQTVRLSMPDALPVLGQVQRVANSSSASTRMFEVDVTPIGSHALKPGMSVSAQIDVAQSQAHFISPAWLFLDDQGSVGVKAVDENNVVEFYPVELVQAQAQGFYVAGLPDTLDIITVGAGFVNTGSTVEVAR